MSEQLTESRATSTLFYVYDPMCSWCWGYRPTWQLLQEQLRGVTEVQYCVGGLAPDNDQTMPEDMQRFLQQTWSNISSQLGTEFNFDFWRSCQPKRSTYPACRAVLVARERGLEQAMFLAIQQGYYLQAKNPSELNCLAELAVSVGFDKNEFMCALASDKINLKLMQEISFARSLPINGFPSLVLCHNDKAYSIPIDYKDWQVSFQDIMEKLAR